MMPNSPRFAAAFLAVTRIGAVAVLLSTLYQAPELRWVLGHADVGMLLTFDRYLRHDYVARLETALPSLAGQHAGALHLPEAPFLRSVLVWGQADRRWAEIGPDALRAAAAARPEIDEAFLARIEASVAPADPLCIIHTSGSTANPKAIVHGHGPFIRHTFQLSRDFWASEQGDRIISSRPYFWIGGLSTTLFHTLHLGHCIIVPDDQSGAGVRKLIETEGATTLCGDETWFRAVSADPDLTSAYEVFRIGLDVCGLARRTADGPQFINPVRAAAIPRPQHIHEDRFARFFGMTESGGPYTASYGNALLPPDLPRSCGRSVPGVEIKIVDVETRAALAPGEAGELLVKGYCMMQGMYKREVQHVFDAEGFYPTGDICSQDEAGFITFHSRLGHMIKIHGANVAPLEVESALMALPGIERASVVGVDLPETETLLVAAIQLGRAAHFSAPSVQRELKTILSSFKVPRYIFALAEDEMPIGASGKIDRNRLTALLSAKLLETLSG